METRTNISNSVKSFQNVRQRTVSMVKMMALPKSLCSSFSLGLGGEDEGWFFSSKDQTQKYIEIHLEVYTLRILPGHTSKPWIWSDNWEISLCALQQDQKKKKKKGGGELEDKKKYIPNV